MSFFMLKFGGLNAKRRYKISEKIMYNYDYIYSFVVTIFKGGDYKLWLNMKHK
jgi:hypothetical protein